MIEGPFCLFQTVSLGSTLAIWPYETPHRVGILQRPLGLFAGRSGRPTRKKSPRNQGVLRAAFQEELHEGSQQTYHHTRQGVGTSISTCYAAGLGAYLSLLLPNG